MRALSGAERPRAIASIRLARDRGPGADPLPMTHGRPGEAASPFGALYARPATVASRSATWPDGRYVFRHRRTTGPSAGSPFEVVNRRAARVPAAYRPPTPGAHPGEPDTIAIPKEDRWTWD